jgi:hypothetical protein
MNKTRILVKQINHGLYAHIYEHIVANRIDTSLLREGLLPVISYSFYAETWNGVASLHFETYNDSTLEIFDNIAKVELKRDILLDELHRAIEECAGEYERNLRSIDADRLLSVISSVHKTEWLQLCDFDQVYSDEKDKAFSEFATDFISYGKRSPNSFQEVNYTYTLPSKFCKEYPDLKPLAAVAVQALALLQIRFMADAHRGYDKGDEWAEYHPYVGYYHSFIYNKKLHMTLEEVLATYSKGLNAARRNMLVEKVLYLLRDTYQNVDNYYFSAATLHAISGSIIGSKGWAKIATEKNMLLTLKNISVEIEMADNKKTIRGLEEVMV